MDFRSISSSTADKLEQLYRHSRFPFFRQGPQVATISELGDSREPAVLPHMVCCSLSSSGRIRHAAKVAVSKLLAAVPVDCLMQFDAQVRAFDWMPNGLENDWSVLTPPTISRFVSGIDIGILALASMHPSGHVREAALRVVAVRNDGEELPYLLLRANDWVQPIRNRAREQILARIRAGYASFFLKCLPLVLQLERCARSDHRWLSEAVGKLLTQDDCRSVLQAGLNSNDRNIRRACLCFIDETSALALKPALVAALSDPEVTIRLWAARRLLSITSGDELSFLCAKLEQDPFMPVRREAIYARLQANDELSPSVLQKALLDKHTSLRELARFHLKQTMDIAEFYRGAVETEEGIKLVAVIQGLGECGSEADADQVAPFLEPRETRLRRAAVFSIGRLAANRFNRTLLRALEDNSPGVSATALGALRPIAQALSIQEIALLLSRGSAPFTRINALLLLSRFSKWDQIPLYLSACRDPVEEVARRAAAAVRLWLGRYHKSYTVRPCEIQLTNAFRELSQSQEFLDVGTVNHLEALFKEWMK